MRNALNGVIARRLQFLNVTGRNAVFLQCVECLIRDCDLCEGNELVNE